MKTRIDATVIGLVSLLAILTFVSIWLGLYPSESDPKNIKYVLWKYGFYSMDLDIAADTMVGDAKRDSLVIGKTREQLKSKFGYLLALSEARPYLQSCHQQYWAGRDVMFIRQSNWMVVFDGDRAGNLVLIKGC